VVDAEHAQSVLANARCVADTAAVRSAYQRLARVLTRNYADKNPLILVLMIGGMFAAAEILRRVSFPLEVDYIHATRYRGETAGGSLLWRHRTDAPLTGRHVLVIDDILDEGYTLAAVREELLARSPASLAVAVLAQKQHDRLAPGARAEFIGLQLPDAYVFGCGLDYKNFWRQLPAIYAVSGAV
jgi:hypoxanthine phosphoribosyltransferase